MNAVLSLFIVIALSPVASAQDTGIIKEQEQLAGVFGRPLL
jgi:hypothetical protein